VQKGNDRFYNQDPEQNRNAEVSNVSWKGWMTGPSRPGAVGDCASGDYTVFNQNEPLLERLFEEGNGEELRTKRTKRAPTNLVYLNLWWKCPGGVNGVPAEWVL